MEIITNFAQKYGVSADEIRRYIIEASGSRPAWTCIMAMLDERGIDPTGADRKALHDAIGKALELGLPDATPAALISGIDPAPTAPVAALEPAPTAPEPESTEAFWRRIVGAAPETPANLPESTREADPAPETGNHASADAARMRAILGAPEAKGRQRFAEHLACHTDLDVEAARAALVASPVEAKAAPAPTPKLAPVPAARPETTRPTEPLAPATSQDWARQQLHGGNADADALWKRAIERTEKKGGLA